MMPESYPTLALEHPQAHVLEITLNRPEAANAFNTQMATDLMHCFEALALDGSEIRCAILTGSGDKAFCAGGDLKERDDMTDEAWSQQHLVYERMIRAVIGCPIPVIAAVNGAAFGGPAIRFVLKDGGRRAEIANGFDVFHAASFDCLEANRHGDQRGEPALLAVVGV